ncbi:hypothetical protein GGR57DRAFT_242937 [Xylariaceae sp. FL1272]|nr:hypothetical protein GGR57DRAFT_242937 [Xylariaceae sp. FL1272]
MSQSDDMDNMDGIAVYEMNGGNGDDGADILFDFSGQRIHVTILPCSSSQNECENNFLEDRLIHLINRAILTEDMDEHETIVDEVLEPILEVGRVIFREAASRNVSTCEKSEQDLQALLYPLILTFGFKTIGGKAAIVPISASETYTILEPTPNHGLEEELGINTSLPQYSARNVVVLETFSRGAGRTVSRVLVEGKEMVCRAQKNGLLDPSLEKEVTAFQKITDACQSKHCRAPMRVPRLLGYVRHDEKGHIIGLLREWVAGRSLRHVDIATTLVQRRQKWALQVRDTVEQLHEIGVVWGDGKAGNVVVDEKDEAWLIDFGGGWSDGWVDREVAGTRDGDEQAVRSIVKFLDVTEDNKIP